MTTDIRIRAFRAIDDPETCLKFITGHRRVLSIYGIENITTNTDDWMFNPSIFVVVVESLDGEKLYGGSRLQAADGIHPLPIEEATGKLDEKIYDEVKYYSQFGVAEISGLWNSKEVAGLGVGSLFPTRVAIVIAPQVGVSNIFSLCSPTTVRFNEWMGSDVFTSVGTNGTFYYPKLDLIATAVLLPDVDNLVKAHPREREKIMFLRNNLHCVIQEKSPFKNVYINVHYDLKILSANPEEFKLPVENKFID
ncbi:MAG: hypothetical protein JWQ09_1623 [Segetibacter sp.]|nr:hypothetical protein [Segetibacter sp.]